MSISIAVCQDATAAVRLLGASKRARIQALRRQLELEASRAAFLLRGMKFCLYHVCSVSSAVEGCWSMRASQTVTCIPMRSSWPAGRNGLQAANLQHADAREFVNELLQSTAETWKAKDPNRQCLDTRLEMYDQHGELRLRPEVHLQQPVRDTEIYTRAGDRHLVLHAVVRAGQSPLAEEILSEMAICTQMCGNAAAVTSGLARAFANGFQVLAGLLDAAYRSLDFYTWQLRGISSAEELGGYTCSICLCSADSLAELAMLPCSHVFHRSCALPALRQQSRCPQCRQQASIRTMSSALLELQEGPSPEPSEPEVKLEEMAPELRKHGSKLHAIAKCLHKIRADDPTAKAIVFVQWKELEDRVAAALQTHRLPTVQLPRGPNVGRAVATAMRDFCTSTDSFVLLLSLDNVASGTNLTAANHVFFVHPMNADLLSTAVAYEKQALARVRRVGQARSEVHAWRFVTRHTVEEHIHNLHQSHRHAAAGA